MASLKKFFKKLGKMFGFGKSNKYDYYGTEEVTDYHTQIKGWVKRYNFDSSNIQYPDTILGTIIKDFINKNMGREINLELINEFLTLIKHLRKYRADDEFDYWETPYEMMKLQKGDCEGWGALVFYVFKQLGCKNARLGIFLNKTSDAHTMWLYFDKQNAIVLDTMGTAYSYGDIKRIDDIKHNWRLIVSYDLEKEYVHMNSF